MRVKGFLWGIWGSYGGYGVPMGDNGVPMGVMGFLWGIMGFLWWLWGPYGGQWGPYRGMICAGYPQGLRDTCKVRGGKGQRSGVRGHGVMGVWGPYGVPMGVMGSL